MARIRHICLSVVFQMSELNRYTTAHRVAVAAGLCAGVLAIAPTTTTSLVLPLSEAICGPQIASGFTWWQIGYEQIIGRIAENWQRVIAHQTQLNPTLGPTPSSATLNPTPSNLPGLAFSEEFSTPSVFSERFDHGWSGEWNAGSMWGGNRNDWHADHGMMCENPNTSGRAIHLTSQEQANDAAFYSCMPGGDPNKGHLMTSVNTEGYVTAWFSPKQTFHNVTKVCWDQNITNLGGGKWTTINFLTAAEYAGKTDLGYTSADFPKGGASSPQGAAANGVKVFYGGMTSYTNSQLHEGARGITVADKAVRYKHCVVDNGNGRLTTTIAQPNGGTIERMVVGKIPDGDIRVEFADDSYNPDKHFNAHGVAPNSSGLYTWHWDNIQIYTANQRE
jgi:hypothetical protein